MSWERIRAMCTEHRVDYTDVVGPSRRRRICRARYSIAKTLREEGWSYDEIGEALGGRNHSTIICGIRTHERKANATSAVE